MRVLILSSMFPPDAPGGAEISAWNFARWLRDHGHEVGVLTTARRPADEADAVMEDGLRIWRLTMPRPYAMQEYGAQPELAKMIWHLQDHLDPRNQAMLRHVLDEFRPDVASVHLLTGLGWNMLSPLAERDIPVLFALPDVVIACLRSGMFRKGKNCERQCRDCKWSSRWKQYQLARIPRLGFYSPSAANLKKLETFVSLGTRPREIISNPNRYPPPETPHHRSTTMRFLYAGRLHPTKGLDVLLAAADALAARGIAFSLAIVGDGPIGDQLREQYADRPWVVFHGHVSQQAVSDLMAGSDILCLPSVWAENAPGVAIQALSQGMPILASNQGGIPELIEAGETGELVAAGDVAAWIDAMAAIVADPERVSRMRQNALDRKAAFDPERSGQKLFDLIGKIMAGGGQRTEDNKTDKG